MADAYVEDLKSQFYPERNEEDAPSEPGSYFFKASSQPEQTSEETLTLRDELAEYDEASRDSILRGLSQEPTIDRGSFAKYVE